MACAGPSPPLHAFVSVRLSGCCGRCSYGAWLVPRFLSFFLSLGCRHGQQPDVPSKDRCTLDEPLLALTEAQVSSKERHTLSESVLLSWPSRSRCRVSVVATHGQRTEASQRPHAMPACHAMPALVSVRLSGCCGRCACGAWLVPRSLSFFPEPALFHTSAIQAPGGYRPKTGTHAASRSIAAAACRKQHSPTSKSTPNTCCKLRCAPREMPSPRIAFSTCIVAAQPA